MENEDISSIKQELNKRLEKIITYSNMVIDLKIQLKESEIENLKLKKEINKYNSECALNLSK
jgi:ribosome-associated translation inhibitor RaiA